METTLLRKKAGDIVNLENDMIGKYVERLMSLDAKEENAGKAAAQKSSITMDFLMEHGF